MTNDLTQSGFIRSFRFKAYATTSAFQDGNESYNRNLLAILANNVVSCSTLSYQRCERIPKKDKIGSKPDKNGKRGKAEKSQKQLQWIKKEKLKKMQKEGPEMHNPTKFIRRKKEQGLNLQFTERYKERDSSCLCFKVDNFPSLKTDNTTMTDNRTMAEMLRTPTEGCAEAIIVPPILAEQFKLKHRASRKWLEKEPPCSITTWDDLVSKFINEFFPPSRTTNLRNEISNFQQKFDEYFHEAWERYKDLLRACPHHGFTKLHQWDTFYNALNPADQDSLNAAAGGNLLEKSLQDALAIIENKSKVKAVEEIRVTCGGAHLYYQCLAAGGNTFPEFRDNIQGYVLAAAGNYNQGNLGYRPQGVANQMRPQGFAQPNVQNNPNQFSQPQGFTRTNFNQEQPYQATAQSNQNFHLNELDKIKRMNDVSQKAMQNQIDMVKNELRNEMKTSIQTSLSNQTNEIKNMMASILQMNIASTSGLGSLPGNTVANPKSELKAITTRSGLVTDGPTVPTPPKSVNPEEDECVEETYTDPDLAEYTIKVPPPPVQKPKPPIQRNFVLHTRDSPSPHIPYPLRMLKQKQQEKDDIQI
nr:hypothetical protein [Tanacetum cinerariifolium]